MNSDASSVAAGELPHQEMQTDEDDAAIKAFEDLFDASGDQTAKDPLPPREEDPNREVDYEEEDKFLLRESQNFIPGNNSRGFHGKD